MHSGSDPLHPKKFVENAAFYDKGIHDAFREISDITGVTEIAKEVGLINKQTNQIEPLKDYCGDYQIQRYSQRYDEEEERRKKQRMEAKDKDLKENKGLRHFSRRVCQKVEEKLVTNYNEVADELVMEFNNNPSDAPIDQKNIRRRVYDALNVLMAMKIIEKDKKDIKWIGLPTQEQERDMKVLRAERMELLEVLQQKREFLEDLVVKKDLYTNLIKRNQNRANSQPKEESLDRIHIPFVVIHASKDTKLQLEMSRARDEYFFDFTHPFYIIDDCEVLKQMGLETPKPVFLQTPSQNFPYQFPPHFYHARANPFGFSENEPPVDGQMPSQQPGSQQGLAQNSGAQQDAQFNMYHSQMAGRMQPNANPNDPYANAQHGGAYPGYARANSFPSSAYQKLPGSPSKANAVPMSPFPSHQAPSRQLSAQWAAQGPVNQPTYASNNNNNSSSSTNKNSKSGSLNGADDFKGKPDPSLQSAQQQQQSAYPYTQQQNQLYQQQLQQQQRQQQHPSIPFPSSGQMHTQSSSQPSQLPSQQMQRKQSQSQLQPQHPITTKQQQEYAMQQQQQMQQYYQQHYQQQPGPSIQQKQAMTQQQANLAPPQRSTAPTSTVPSQKQPSPQPPGQQPSHSNPGPASTQANAQAQKMYHQSPAYSQLQYQQYQQQFANMHDPYNLAMQHQYYYGYQMAPPTQQQQLGQPAKPALTSSSATGSTGSTGTAPSTAQPNMHVPPQTINLRSSSGASSNNNNNNNSNASKTPPPSLTPPAPTSANASSTGPTQRSSSSTASTPIAGPSAPTTTSASSQL